MKIEDVLNITQGELVNSPTLQAVEGATAYTSKVELGDLFFARVQEDIEVALKRGAYGVVFEGEIPKIIDEEVAWIRVESVREASFRLLRYVQLKKRAKFFLLSPHQLTFLRMILKFKGDIEILSDDWVRAFENILNGQKEIFVGSDESLISSVEPNFQRVSDSIDGEIITSTLFKSTFKVKGFIYQERELSPIHFDYLLEAITLLEELGFEYSLDRLRYTPHLFPIFIDKNLNRLPSGKSDKVAIFCDNLRDIIKAREFIRYENRWLKSIVLTPPKVRIENLKRSEWFESESEAREILKSRDFNYAFIYGVGEEILSPKSRENTTLI